MVITHSHHQSRQILQSSDKMLEMNIDTLLQAAEYLDRRERGGSRIISAILSRASKQFTVFLIYFSVM